MNIIMIYDMILVRAIEGFCTNRAALLYYLSYVPPSTDRAAR